MKLIPHFHATASLKISGVLPPFPKTSSWRDFQAGTGTILLSFTTIYGRPILEILWFK
jgi:hypothetical protein